MKQRTEVLDKTHVVYRILCNENDVKKCDNGY